MTDSILIVEDELLMRRAIMHLLTHAGYRVIEAEDGATALRVLKSERPGMAIIDVNMPGLSGLELLERMRRQGWSAPVLMLSGLGEVEDRLKGLGHGADDYMGKPFDPRELIARVGALLRRRRPDIRASNRRLTWGNLAIDLDEKRAERAGKEFSLTATEFAILQSLANGQGRPVSREQLLEEVWGYSAAQNTRTVETHIWRLRKKLGDPGDETGWIQNRQGLGYILASPVEEKSPSS